MTISIFTAGSEQSHWITRSGVSPAPAGQTVVEMGDATKSGGSDARRSTYHSWDIDGIPKNAIVDEAYVEWVPTQSDGQDLDTDNFEHAMALMFADGHWNRGDQNELHQAQGGAYYHAPAQTDALFFAVRNSVDVEIADTIPTFTAPTLLSNGTAALQGLGTTVEIPAGEDIKVVRVVMNRLDTPLPANPTLTIKLYTLFDNGRQFALDTLVASSDPIAYSVLAAAPGSSSIDFTFATAIPSQAAARWVGLMIEGEIFDPIYLGTQRYQLIRENGASQIVFPPGTAGSMLTASASTDIANANSLVGYFNERSVPCLYPISSSTLITTPYQRYFGTVMTKRQCGPWSTGVPKTYGSAVASEEFPNFVQNIQDWIDSAHYSPDLGKTWIGFMIDIPSPENVIFRSAGPTHPTLVAYKLIINWHTLVLLDVGDLIRRTVVTASDLTRRIVVTAGDLTSQMAVAVGDLTRRTTITAGDLTRRTKIMAGNLIRRTDVTAGGLTRRTDVTAGDLKHRTDVTAGDLKRRATVTAGDLKRRATVTAGDLKRRTTVTAGNLKRGGS
ncbi:hypothetical protein LCGC14_1790190 [marine sediment metagenome]|uniref:Uncharacterized protein n=1 Tax=marine sediment metagenome TaxID=412755 RepID=A0A0F9HFC7_9ZZZZ